VKEAKRIEKLRRDHSPEGFSCGRDALDRYPVRYAWQNQQAGAEQTYLGIVGEAIVGYYTLAVGHVLLEVLPSGLRRVWPGIRFRSCYSRV
jgi:hypothetical protein